MKTNYEAAKGLWPTYRIGGHSSKIWHVAQFYGSCGPSSYEGTYKQPSCVGATVFASHIHSYRVLRPSLM